MDPGGRLPDADGRAAEEQDAVLLKMARTICLVTPAQPSSNPRLVKEADALAERGYRVEVVCSYYHDWAMKADRALLESKDWSCSYVGGTPGSDAATYWWTRVRFAAARRLVRALGLRRWLRKYALSRTFVELERKAKAIAADLYIAHNLEALPAVAAAGRLHGKPFGFDVEDFIRGRLRSGCRLTASCCVGSKRSTTALRLHHGGGSGDRRGVCGKMSDSAAGEYSERVSAFRASGGGGPAGGWQWPLSLYWVSQTIGDDRGLEDIVRAMGRVPGHGVHLHLQGQWQPGYRERLVAVGRSAGVEEGQIHHLPPAGPDELVGMAGFDIGLALEQAAHENRQIA